MCSVPRSCLTLCDPMDCSPPGSSIHGIFQARVLEWVAISFFKGFSWPRDGTRISCVSCLAGGFFITEPPESTAFKNCESQYCTPITYINIVHQLNFKEYQKKKRKSQLKNPKKRKFSIAWKLGNIPDDNPWIKSLKWQKILENVLYKRILKKYDSLKLEYS